MHWTLLYFLALRTLAIPYPSPSETPAGYRGGGAGDGDAALGWTPLPTAAPRELLRRDAGKICGSMVGDDNTTTPLPCDNDGYTCFRETALTAIGCCRRSDAGFSSCRIHTTCVNEAQTCLDACMSNPLIKKCSKPTPSCGTWVWPNDESSFECDTVTFLANVFSPSEGSLPVKRAPATTSGTVYVASSSSSSSLTAPTGTATAVPANRPSNTAAIGGAAGGGALALLVVIAIAVCILRRRWKGKDVGEGRSTVQVEGPKEMDGSAVPRAPANVYVPSEMSADNHHRIPVVRTLQEKDERAELPGSTNEVGVAH